EAQIDVLTEVHDRDELRRALHAGARIVGVNNRDLRTLDVSLRTSFFLAPLVPDDVVAVAESGIRNADDIRRLRDEGFDAFLVGERLMEAREPGAALSALLHDAAAPSLRPQGQRRTLIKICGITTIEDGLMVARAGADAVGFVFWEGSTRKVDVAAAREIAQALPAFVLRVGVFVDEAPQAINRICDEVGLGLVQLHGSEPPEGLAQLSRRAIKAVPVGDGFAPEDALRYLGRAAGLLLDTRIEGAVGGTGKVFDWGQAGE